jgi:hypothetical protein
MRITHFLPFVAAAIAAPVNVTTEPSNSNLIPQVKIKDGTVVGIQVGFVENFKGIPFAEPPVGPLRLKPPQPLKKGFGTFVSQLIPNSCPQFYTQVDRKNLPSSVIGLLANSPFFQEVTFQYCIASPGCCLRS